MVHLDEMCHLVRNDIVDDPFGRKEQSPAECEIALSGTAAPAALCVTHRNLRHAPVDASRNPPCSSSELPPRNPNQMVADPVRDIRAISAHPNLAITDRHRGCCGVSLASNGMGNAEHGYNNALVEGYRLWEGCQTGRNPLLFGSEKSQTMGGRHAWRQNEFNFPLGRVHAQRDPPRARANADGYAAAEVICRSNLPPVIPKTQRLIQPSATCEPNVAARNIEIRARNPCSVLETGLVVPVAGRTRAESGRSTCVLLRVLAIEEMDE